MFGGAVVDYVGVTIRNMSGPIVFAGTVANAFLAWPLTTCSVKIRSIYWRRSSDFIFIFPTKVRCENDVGKM
jgi:hypothetical protein